MADSASGVRIIRANLEHVDSIVPLFDGYVRFYEQDRSEEDIRRFIADRIERDESIIFLATLPGEGGQDEAGAFTQVYPTFSSVRMQRVLVLNDLFVAPQHQGKQLGRRLTERVITLAEEMHAAAVILETAENNTVARGLYDALGFERDVGFCHYTFEMRDR